MPELPKRRKVRHTLSDSGLPVWQKQCPSCKEWQTISGGQVSGKVPVVCECGFKEKKSMKFEAEKYLKKTWDREGDEAWS